MTKGYFTALMKHIGYSEEQIENIIECAIENGEIMGYTESETLEREWETYKIYG